LFASDEHVFVVNLTLFRRAVCGYKAVRTLPFFTFQGADIGEREVARRPE